MLAGCPQGPRRTAPSAAPPPVAAQQPVPTAIEPYTVVSSHLTVRAYRDGPLARLGHNHVISTTALVGDIDLAEPVAASRFRLSLPLASFTVDLADERAAAGVDAARQPVLTIECLALAGGPEAWQARLRIGLAGASHDVDVPFRLSRDTNGLDAAGQVTLDHAALGLEPYSVGLGMLRVRPDLTIAFTLRARPADR
jgi:hypothetical protein